MKPEEYLVIKDHLRGSEIPINFKLQLGSLQLDQSWQPVLNDSLPVRPAGISVDCEINPDCVSEVHAESWSMTPRE